MPQSVGTVTATLQLNTAQAAAQYRRFQQTLNSSATARGNLFSSISADAKDFENSLGKATNRVVAFGAAAAVFGTIAKSASLFAQSIVEVDASLARINVNLGQSTASIKEFGAQVFNVARQTGQTFDVAAKAAEELARQGLSAEETIDRLQKALVLSRIAGISSADAVETLTAAINSFNQSALTATEVVNKFAAVDTKFAVSSKDLAEAVSRVGSTAQAAGVGIDELIGLVTSLQQTTARGGATIGNGLKTIFTRIQAAPETVEALQSIGVAIKNTDGSLRDAISILRDYAVAREKVGEVERQSLDRTVAGTFQINILKAALTDLNKEYSVYGSAVKTSANATDEAIRKNEMLNKTLSSLINSTSTSIKELFASIGGETVGPVLGELLKYFEKARGFFSGETGSDLGKSLGEGLIKGISSVISGPALGALLIILGSAFKKVLTTIAQEARTLLAINNAVTARASAQREINNLLVQANALERAQLATAHSTAQQYETLLAVRQRLNQEAVVGTPLTNAAVIPQGGLFGRGRFKVDPRLRPGGVPGFADPVRSAIGREISASGLPASQIYVDQDARVASFANPMGLLVANKRDEPFGGFQGVSRVIAQGGNPKTNGIPGFAISRRGLPSDFGYNFQRQYGGNVIGDHSNPLPGWSNSPLKGEGIQITNISKLLQSYAQSVSAGSTVMTKYIKEQVKSLKLDRASQLSIDRSFEQIEQEYVQQAQAARESTKAAQTKAKQEKKQKQKGLSQYKSAIGPQVPEPVPAKFTGTTQYQSPIGPTQRTPTLAQIRAQIAAGRKNGLREDVGQAVEVENGGVFDAKAYRRSSAYNSPIGPLNPNVPYSNPIGPAFPVNPKLADRLGKKADEDQALRAKKAIQAAREKAIRQSEIRSKLQAMAEAKRQKDAAIEAAAIEEKFTRSQSRRGKVASSIVARRQRLQNRSLGASFALPLVGGFAEPAIQGLGFSTKGGTGGGVAAGAISYGTSGAGVGGLFGPAGLAIGGAIGALVGAFSKLKKSTEETSAEIDEQIAKRSSESEALSRAVQLQEQLNDAIKEGADQPTIDKLQSSFRQARSSLQEDKSRSLLNISDPRTQAKAIIGRQEELGRENAKAQVQQSLLDSNIVNQFKGGNSGNEKLANTIRDALDDTDVGKITDDQFLSLSKIAGGNFEKPVSNAVAAAFGTPEAFAKAAQDNIKAAEEFSKAADALAPLANKAGIGRNQITPDTINGLALALLQAASGKRGIANEQTKTAQKAGLLPGAFTSPIDTTPLRQAGFNARNPFNLTQNQRGQSQFGFFNSLIGAGAVDETRLQDNDAYKKSKAVSQNDNLFKSILDYVKDALGAGGGEFTNDRGEANPKVLLEALRGLSKRKGEQGSQASFLLDLGEKGLNTKENVGVKPIPELINSLAVGTKYSTYAPGSSKDTRITVNPYGLDNDYEKRASDKAAARAFVDAHTPIGGRGAVTVTRGPDSPPVAGPVVGEANLTNQDLYIKSYEKLIADQQATAELLSKVLDQSTVNMVVTVNGLGDPNVLAQIQASLQTIFNNQAASAGKPNPPAPQPQNGPRNFFGLAPSTVQ